MLGLQAVKSKKLASSKTRLICVGFLHNSCVEMQGVVLSIMGECSEGHVFD